MVRANNTIQRVLDRKVNPNNLEKFVSDTLHRLENGEARDVRADQLDELADAIGNLDYRAVDEEGRIRMVMSALSLLEEFGIEAHLAGFDENGRPQIWIDADHGSLKGASGAFTLDDRGIKLTGSSNAFLIYDSDHAAWSYIYQYEGTLILQTFRATGTQQLENNDFETGDLTSWFHYGSEYGKISVVEDEGKSVCKIDAEADHTLEYLNQTVSASNGCFVIIRYKNNGTDTSHIFVTDGGYVTWDIPAKSSDWATVVVWFENGVTDFNISADVEAGDAVYIDDVEFWQRLNSGTQAGVYIGDGTINIDGTLKVNGDVFSGPVEIIDSDEVGALGSPTMSLAVGAGGPYKMIDVVWTGRSNRAGAVSDNMEAILNLDSGNNYDWEKTALYYNTTVITEGTADDHMEVGVCTAANAVSGDFGQGYIRFIDPSSTSKNKDGQSRTMVRLGTASGYMRLYDFAIHYRSPNAISAVRLYLTNGSFVQHSKAYLIGYK